VTSFVGVLKVSRKPQSRGVPSSGRFQTRSMPVGSSLPSVEQSIAKERKRKRRERAAVQLTRVLESTGAVADAAEEFKAQVKKTRGAARKAAELGA
jgi:flavin-binding protein dodecin